MSATSQRGFSLLELIASLAIVALVSAAVFQSMASWMRLSVRASGAADASLSSIASQQMFDRVVGGLTFAWPEEEGRVFEGAPDGFSGLTATPLDGFHPRLAPVAITITAPDGSNNGSVVYQSGDALWTLEEFDGEASFSYLDADAVWRPAWPPDESGDSPPLDESILSFGPPQLPVAIRLELTDKAVKHAWIADIAADPRIPQRAKDLQ